jgi:hypothetical protein
MICPAAGYVVVVLANLDPPNGHRISNLLLTGFRSRRSMPESRALKEAREEVAR